MKLQSQTLFSSTLPKSHGADRHGVEATDGAQAQGRGQPGHLIMIWVNLVTPEEIENPTKNHQNHRKIMVIHVSFPSKSAKNNGDSLIPFFFG